MRAVGRGGGGPAPFLCARLGGSERRRRARGGRLEAVEPRRVGAAERRERRPRFVRRRVRGGRLDARRRGARIRVGDAGGGGRRIRRRRGRCRVEAGGKVGRLGSGGGLGRDRLGGGRLGGDGTARVGVDAGEGGPQVRLGIGQGPPQRRGGAFQVLYQRAPFVRVRVGGFQLPAQRLVLRLEQPERRLV